MNKLEEIKIAIIGLGYVGLPLAVAFGRKMPVIGYDINSVRTSQLRQSLDSTGELSEDQIKAAAHLRITDKVDDLMHCNCFIVTVPTPVDHHNQPVFTPLIQASYLVGSFLKKDDLVIYESTVYPGATESECIPVLEKKSSLKLNEDFYVGYSPERINPGDKDRDVTSIKKITSGSTVEAANLVDQIYRQIITAGTYVAPSIKVAEAAKVIENTQRDLNIALINELAMIFNKMEIDTEEVLKAASTKWNFLGFRPGLVGGHCIGVDPYYLTHIAQSIGYHPEIILAGRRINNGMSNYVVMQMLKAMSNRKMHLNGSKVLIMGLSFKENCSDIRNTRVVEVYKLLKDLGSEVDVVDPWVLKEDALRECNIKLIAEPEAKVYDAIVLAVAHKQFADMGAEKIRSFGRDNCIIYDLKSILPADSVDLRL